MELYSIKKTGVVHGANWHGKLTTCMIYTCCNHVCDYVYVVCYVLCAKEKIAKNCEKQEKERLRTQKKQSNPLQFANNA